MPRRTYRERRGLSCRERPWLAGGELILAVWPDLTFAHWPEPTHAGRSERSRAERPSTAVAYLAELIVTHRPVEAGQVSSSRPELRLGIGSRPEIRVLVGLGSGSVSRRLRVTSRNIGLGSARPVPG